MLISNLGYYGQPDLEHRSLEIEMIILESFSIGVKGKIE